MVAGVALVVLMPIMLMTAIVLRFLMEEPIILSERLCGRGGRTFVGYKFRIHFVNANGSRWANCFAEALRGSCLDQLPQFLNVIWGDMSLIGPRPRAAAEFRDYFVRAPECLLARPGFISIGQSYHPTYANQRAEVALDRYYVRNWSIALDLALLSKAISAAAHRDDRTGR